MSDIKTIREQVLQAVLDIEAAGRIATRLSVKELSGITQVKVDDHLQRLSDDSLLTRPPGTRGVYQSSPDLEKYDPVSVTSLHCGSVKVEKGDEMMMFTPREFRQLALMSGGFALGNRQ